MTPPSGSPSLDVLGWPIPTGDEDHSVRASSCCGGSEEEDADAADAEDAEDAEEAEEAEAAEAAAAVDV